MIDFSNCDIDLSVNYNGANGKKACIIYNNERYMIKTAGLAKDNPNIVVRAHILSVLYMMSLGMRLTKLSSGNSMAKWW